MNQTAKTFTRKKGGNCPVCQKSRNLKKDKKTNSFVKCTTIAVILTVQLLQQKAQKRCYKRLVRKEG
jgi:hypothetical protein